MTVPVDRPKEQEPLGQEEAWEDLGEGVHAEGDHAQDAQRHPVPDTGHLVLLPLLCPSCNHEDRQLVFLPLAPLYLGLAPVPLPGPENLYARVQPSSALGGKKSLHIGERAGL